MVFLVKGTYMLGSRTVDKDGNIVNETKPLFTSDPDGGSVAVGILDDETLQPVGPAELFGDFQPWNYLSYALELLKPTRRGNIPDFKAITQKLSEQNPGLCPYRRECKSLMYCSDCIVSEWISEAEEDG